MFVVLMFSYLMFVVLPGRVSAAAAQERHALFIVICPHHRERELKTHAHSQSNGTDRSLTLVTGQLRTDGGVWKTQGFGPTAVVLQFVFSPLLQSPMVRCIGARLQCRVTTKLHLHPSAV